MDPNETDARLEAPLIPLRGAGLLVRLALIAMVMELQASFLQRNDSLGKMQIHVFPKCL
jgi:hypothetical protein